MRSHHSGLLEQNSEFEQFSLPIWNRDRFSLCRLLVPVNALHRCGSHLPQNKYREASVCLLLRGLKYRWWNNILKTTTDHLLPEWAERTLCYLTLSTLIHHPFRTKWTQPGISKSEGILNPFENWPNETSWRNKLQLNKQQSSLYFDLTQQFSHIMQCSSSKNSFKINVSTFFPPRILFCLNVFCADNNDKIKKKNEKKTNI